MCVHYFYDLATTTKISKQEKKRQEVAFVLFQIKFLLLTEIFSPKWMNELKIKLPNV